MDKKVNIFGVGVNNISMEEAVEQVMVWLKGQARHYIVTPNPEFIMAAQKDLEFREVLNKADLAIPDGAGLKLAHDIVCTVSGVDLMDRLCKVASENGFTIGLLGGRGKVAEKCGECLKKKYPGLKIIFAESGGEVGLDGCVIARSGSDEAISKTRLPRSPWRPRNDKKADILFVAFGAVKQEKWITKNLEKLPVKVAMGVGGAFDYLSGEVPRAPLWMRNLGLEWLFRLILQPWRIKRQLVLIRFVEMVINSKFKGQNSKLQVKN